MSNEQLRKGFCENKILFVLKKRLNYGAKRVSKKSFKKLKKVVDKSESGCYNNYCC